MHFTRRVDLVQDAATDCSVVASLCAGTARGERGHTKILSSVIYPYDQQNLRPIISPNGKYVVRLNFNGCYRKVIIDDLLPVSKTSRVLHVIDRRNPGLLWPALIEKAYLKVRGGYDFPGSNSGTDLWILCGWIPEQVFLQSDELVPSQLWKRVYSAFTYGDVLVTMGTGKISNRAERETGLAGEHDYAILDMKEVGDQKLFLIKNPWCEGTSWRGSITKPTAEIDGDATAQSIHELLKVHAELTPGTFWMDLNNVIQHFESIYLNWNPGLFTTREDIHFPWDLSTQQDCRGSIGCFISNPQFAVTCKKDDIVWLLLCRHLKDNASPIPPEHGSKIVSSGDMTGFISLYAFGQQGKRVLLSDNALERGPYVDSPQTLLKLNPTEDCTYTIVPSEQDLSPTLHTFTLSALARSPILLAEAAQKYTCQSVVKATWTPGTAGGNAHSPSYSQNPQFGLVITHNTSVSILLQTSDNTLNVHVKLVHGRGRRVHAVTSRDIVVDSGDYHRGCAHAELGELDAGTYTIICSTFESGQLGNVALRVDSMVQTQLRLLPKEGAGLLRDKLNDALFRPGVNKVAAPLAPRRLCRVTVTASHLDGPTSPAARRLSSSTSHSGRSVRGARSLLRATIEIGHGPRRRILIASSNGEYSDSANGVRTEAVDLNPAMLQAADIWLVLERLGGGGEEWCQVEMFCDGPGAVSVGVWRGWDD